MVGAGITGALVAERLTRRGLDVVLIDRERPGRGSTAASTAMLLWEIDRPLAQLVEILGYERAVRCYQASFKATLGLTTLIARLGIGCHLHARESLYLASVGPGSQLEAEARLRERAGLPSRALDYRYLASEYGLSREAAVLSKGAAEADPVLLTNGLLQTCLNRGARIFRANAVQFDDGSRSGHAALEDGIEITANSIVLATGYAMPDIVRPTIHQPASTWAMATQSQPAKLWKDRALIWEASENYHYARTTHDGRIIMGGEDQPIVEPDEREALTAAKARKLRQALKELWPLASDEADYVWSGTFDTTADGLPLIGRVPGYTNIYAAYGYGGNGITFSYLAARLIDLLIAGKNSPLLTDFAIERQ